MRRRIGTDPRPKAAGLAAHIPEGQFPSGVGAPSATLLIMLLLLACLTAVLFGRGNDPAVPQAFVAAQQRFAESAARSLGASANQSLNDLRTLAAASAATDDALLDTLMANGRWRGAVVVEGAERALVSARGEAVPLAAVPTAIAESSLTATMASTGNLLFVAALTLPENRLLVASATLRVPDAGADNGLRQSVFLTTLAGQVVHASHSSADPPQTELAALVQQAGQTAATEPGSLLGPITGDSQPALAYARVAPAGRSEIIDLAVVSAAYGRTGEARSGEAGLVAAAALALVAFLGFFVVRRVVVEPIRVARADALAVAGGHLTTAVRGSGTEELTRIAAAVGHCRDRLARAEPVELPRARQVSALTAVVVSAGVVLGWSVGAVALAADTEPEVPTEIVTVLRDQTGRTTEALRRSVNDGLADLEALATTGEPGPGTLSDLVTSQPRYRSVYVVDGVGRAGEHAGRPPLRATEPPRAEPGVGQQNVDGRVPVLFAQVPLPDSGKTLVGEFDLDHLATLLDQGGGKAKLLDGAFRTISANHGYLAFEEVTDPVQRGQVELAQRGEPVAELTKTSVVAAAAVSGGAVGELGWSVLAEHPIADLALPANATRDDALLVALLATLFALLALGWHVVIVVRPLKRVARAADAIVGGDQDGVIYPQHHDQIGTIAFCLEICRQALTQGTGRLGVVRRPRGAATDETQLMGPADRTQLLDSMMIELPRTRKKAGQNTR